MDCATDGEDVRPGHRPGLSLTFAVSAVEMYGARQDRCERVEQPLVPIRAV